MRVVFDTNVVVSALLFRSGRLTWLRDLWTAGRVVPIGSRATIHELVRVLGYPKFRLEPQEIEVLLAAYLPYCDTVDCSACDVAPLPRCRDPHDREFLCLAAAGAADVLVSGDRAVIALSGKTSFPIESPEEFRHRFE